MVKNEVIDEFVQAIQQPETDPNTTYSAIVSRVDNEGVVWVNLVGSDKETPTASTASEVKRGDNVTVNWRNNKLYIEGNYSDPSAGVERVRYVEGVASDADLKADTAQESANNARRVADEAQKIAGDTNQYFWFTEEGTDTGAHITEVPQDEWNDSTSENYHKGGNLLARSNGIAVRDGLTELATFGASGAVIGEIGNNKRRVEIDTDGLRLMNGTSEKLAHLGYGQVYDETGTLTTARFFTLGSRDPGNVGKDSLLVGRESISSGYCSVSEGRENKAIGNQSHVGGIHCQAKKDNSFAFGDGCVANGVAQFVVGKKNVQDTTSLFIVGSGSLDGDGANAFKVNTNGIYVGDHTSPIGSTPSSGGSTTSLPHNTVTNLAQIKLGAGTWVVIGTCSFASNSTGYRGLYFSKASGTDTGDRYTQLEIANAGGNAMHPQIISIITITDLEAENETVLYLKGRQNSGGALNVTYPGIRAVRIA